MSTSSNLAECVQKRIKDLQLTSNFSANRNKYTIYIALWLDIQCHEQLPLTHPELKVFFDDENGPELQALRRTDRYWAGQTVN